MCDAEENIDFGCAEDNSVFKEIIKNEYENILKDLPEVLSFIHHLQDCISRHRSIIVKLYKQLQKQKIKDVEYTSKKVCNSSTQTCDEDFACETKLESVSENIVDQVKEIAESAVRQTGFVYESSSGMYYDYNTGYYYNAELGLYYDGNSGTYYSYDETTKAFNYHSSIEYGVDKSLEAPTKSAAENIDESQTNNVTENTKNDIKARVEHMVVEEGECSDSEHDSENGSVKGSDDDNDDDAILKEDVLKTDKVITVSPSHFTELNSDVSIDELASRWPPCMRVIVQETGLDNLDVGTLFIVTCSGGTLGREGNHSVTIPDITISKHHAIFKFSEENNHYTVVDLGSRNGTFLNGNRLSVALQESPPHMIEHGNVLRVGSTHLLCHVHKGHETCKDCEPGCLVKPDKGDALNENRQVRHRSELRRLRRKFGLEGPGSGVRLATINSNYVDRAEARRKIVGSSDDNEKTEVASVYESIKSNNKGFKMMSKMGWSEGQALGKDSQSDTAITEPILVEQRPEKAGLGCTETNVLVDESSSTKRKNTIWKKTQKRYKELSE